MTIAESWAIPAATIPKCDYLRAMASMAWQQKYLLREYITQGDIESNELYIQGSLLGCALWTVVKR